MLLQHFFSCSSRSSIGLNATQKFYTNLQAVRWATKKAGGSTSNGRNSIGKRLGVKKFGGEYVIPGNILIRQRGRKYDSGENTKLGRDYTVYSVSEGWVKFVWDQVRKKQIVTVSSINPNIPKKVRAAVE